MFYLPEVSIYIILAEVVLRVLVAVRVIMRRRPVGVTLAWLVLLLLLPVVSVFLYALVGEVRLGSRRLRRYRELTAEIDRELVSHWERQRETASAHDQALRHLAKLATRVGGIPPLKGNTLELSDNAAHVLDTMIKDIDHARDHCHLLYYIWMPKSRGTKVAEALIRAAQRGVDCRVLVDGAGGMAFWHSELPDQMRAGGVQVVEALPVNPLRVFLQRIDLRNHRKVAVIDGTIGYCGSQNLTDETYRYRKRRKRGPWIDATCRIRGPAVQALQSVFLSDWIVESGEKLEALERYFPDTDHPGKSVVHVIASGPGPQPDAIHHAFLAMLFAARSEIIITTSYFVPDEATKGALMNAALRGVSVTLVMPDRLDSLLVAVAARSHYDDLLAAGVRVYHHEEGALHAKAAMIDGSLAVVGSSNFDVRSFWLNYECTLFIYDDDFAQSLRAMQHKYIAESVEILLNRWRARPVASKFVDNCARLMSPLL